MVSTCPQCDYSLRGLPEAHTCPECGLAYDKGGEVFVQRRNNAVLLIFFIGFPAVFNSFVLLRGGVARALQLLFGLLVCALLIRRAFFQRRHRVALMPSGIVIMPPRAKRRLLPWADIRIVEYNGLGGGVIIRGQDGGKLCQLDSTVFGTKKQDQRFAERAEVWRKAIAAGRSRPADVEPC